MYTSCLKSADRPQKMQSPCSLPLRLLKCALQMSTESQPAHFLFFMLILNQTSQAIVIISCNLSCALACCPSLLKLVKIRVPCKIPLAGFAFAPHCVVRCVMLLSSGSLLGFHASVSSRLAGILLASQSCSQPCHLSCRSNLLGLSTGV